MGRPLSHSPQKSHGRRRVMTETLEAFLFYGFNLCPAHHRGSHTDWIAFRAWSGILASGGGGDWDGSGDRGDNWGLISSAIRLAFSPPSCKLHCCFDSLENWIREAHDSMSPAALEPVCRKEPGSAGARGGRKLRRLSRNALPQGGHLHNGSHTSPARQTWTRLLVRWCSGP